MQDIVSLVPPSPPGSDEEDCWYCFEFRVANEDHVSPWFEEEFDIFEYLSEVPMFLITRKYIRTSDGIREDNGLGDYLDLPVFDLDELYQPSGGKSWEDEIVA